MDENTSSLRTSEIMQQAMIKAGLISQDQANRVNASLREKHKKKRRFKHRKQHKKS